MNANDAGDYRVNEFIRAVRPGEVAEVLKDFRNELDILRKSGDTLESVNLTQLLTRCRNRSKEAAEVERSRSAALRRHCNS
jgi:hypothetical protein